MISKSSLADIYTSVILKRYNCLRQKMENLGRREWIVGEEISDNLVSLQTYCSVAD